MIIDVTAQDPYRVVIDYAALGQVSSFLGDSTRVALIYPHHLGSLAQRVTGYLGDRQVLELPVPDAEAAKTPEVLARCWNGLAEAGFTRSDLVVGIGGGSTTDLAGFVAASWLRGVGYVSVPTTVLGMVDAAVGGKTGINLAAGKNLVGAFYEPRGVLCDLELLATLPPDEVRNGLAEVVKCGFIRDQRILELFSEDLNAACTLTSPVFAELVGRAVAVKAQVVSEDLTERTSSGANVGREALNYGHTLGHAIEARERYRWRHGQAISVGMVWIAEVSRRLLGLDVGLAAEHARLLGALGLPTSYPAQAYDQLRRLMSLDKKARGSSLRLVGLAAQGRPVILADASEADLQAAYTAVSE